MAWLPIDEMFSKDPGANFDYTVSEVRLWRLLKLLRIPRLAQLLDVDKFK